jgi:hypothetical protein
MRQGTTLILPGLGSYTHIPAWVWMRERNFQCIFRLQCSDMPVHVSSVEAEKKMAEVLRAV